MASFHNAENYFEVGERECDEAQQEEEVVVSSCVCVDGEEGAWWSRSWRREIKWGGEWKGGQQSR